jgi:hypothetical protein
MFLTSPFIDQAFALIDLNECNGDLSTVWPQAQFWTHFQMLLTVITNASFHSISAR